MANKKITREHKIAIINLVLGIIAISAAIYLIVILGNDLNRFILVQESDKTTEAVNFNFIQYEELGL